MMERDLRWQTRYPTDDDDLWDPCPDDDEFGFEEDIPDSGRDWRRAKGIFVLAPIGGEAGERIAEIQRRFDPKLAASQVPHVTLAGSSGVGPIQAGTSTARLREALEPIAREMAPLSVRFGAPTRFMQTNIVSLPLDPNGPVRALYERLRSSGLVFMPARFAFTPHATLSYFPTLDRGRERELLSLRVTEPAVIDRLELSLTDDPRPPRRLLELRLGDGRRA
ncbi:MAG TPA: 2'-5' RNA ligase family protein [Gemmatimonadaceae bacterium]|nr:2'-5' RNA ligase family protein [Gemmatimonadaceae bacterium]